MKTTPLLATEVVPDKVYLAPHRDDTGLRLLPATVMCTKEPGWLRGFVNIRLGQSFHNRQTGYATVRFIEQGNHVEVPVYRPLIEGAEWVFAAGPEKFQPVTLKPLPEGYFQQREHELRQRINEHVRAIGKLEDALSTLKVVQQRASST